MPPGRPRLPDSRKATTGTLQQCRVNKSQPKPKPLLPARPADDDPYFIAAWEQVSRLVSGMGVVTEADEIALEGFAKTLADYRRAWDALKVNGRVYDRGGGMMAPRPEVRELSDCDKRLVTYLARFGLTPSDRSRVNVVNDEGPSEFDGIFN